MKLIINSMTLCVLVCFSACGTGQEINQEVVVKEGPKSQIGGGQVGGNQINIDGSNNNVNINTDSDKGNQDE